MTITVRVLEKRDVPAFRRMMLALHMFEQPETPYLLTVEDLTERAFGTRPQFGAFVADAGEALGLVGFASHYELPFMNDKRPTLVLKNLWIDEGHRGQAIARRLMTAIARHAVAGGYARLRWSVLPTNEKAAAFYRSLGAAPDMRWTPWLMDDKTLARLALDVDRQ